MKLQITIQRTIEKQMNYSKRKYENLVINIFEDRDQMGKAASDYVVSLINELFNGKEYLNIVFAAAPSQNEFLNHFVNTKSVDWSRINGFHMDEYIGLESNSEKLFSQYLINHLFSKVKMNKIFLINSEADAKDEIERYSKLLKAYPIDIVCMGIGENGHIAFNDPPVADFSDKEIVKIVELDYSCRQQQVNDGCFNNLKEVPTHAITLTIPALMSSKHLSIVVPSDRKAQAVRNSLLGEVTTNVPGSILRNHSSAQMFLDKDAYSLVGS
jgi:glucosamine-6-phosphate deaminase